MLGFVLSFNVIGQVPTNNPAGNSNWAPLWSDDFSTFDATKWDVANDYDNGGGLAVCRSKNATISNGWLELDLVKENYSCLTHVDYWGCRTQYNSPDPHFHYKYTTSLVTSKCDYDFRYGYMEARIKFSNVPGAWGAFWTSIGCNAPNKINDSEIDIVEAYGENQSNFLGINTPEYNTNLFLCYDSTTPALCMPWGDHVTHSVNSSITNPHLYGVEWNGSTINFYLDGVLVRTVTNGSSWGVNDYVKILFDNFVEKEWVTDQTKRDNFPSGPVSMYVDWVRVYKPYAMYYDYMDSYNEIKPYVINPIEDPSHLNKKQISLMWQLPSNKLTTTFTVNWGISTTYGQSTIVSENGNFRHLYKIDISNLLPDTKYYYKIISSDNSIVYTSNFTTPPLNSNNSTNLTFYATGAKAIKDNVQSYTIRENIMSKINNDISSNLTNQTFLILTNGFVTGDNKEYWNNEFFSSTLNWDNFRASYPIIGGLSSNEREKVLSFNLYGNPVGGTYNVIGQNFRTYLPFNYALPSIINGDYIYNHSMNYGPVHLCFPEIEYTNTATNDQSMTFIDNDLGTTTKEWKVLSFDIPLKSLNGDILNSAAYIAVRQKAIDKGVQLVLMGHEDYYAHWVDNGIHFVILGNGGTTTNGINDQKIINSPGLIKASTVPHYAKFKIDGNFMYVDVIQSSDYNGYPAGRVIDKFAIPKTCLITNTQTWNTGVYPIITDYIWVNNGGNLQIESNVQLLKDNTIKVSKGCKLTLTGANAVLTSVDAYTEMIDFVTVDANGNIISTHKSNYTPLKNFWGGIEVNSTPQNNQTNLSDQGLVVINGGATIKNANVGVSLKQAVLVNNQNLWKGGGILSADNANFVDNCTDIQMYPYENTHTLGNGTVLKIPNRTRIIRSNFLTTDNYIDINTKPIKHIVLNGVRSVYLAGNTFNNTNSTMTRAQKGIGIFASESSFNLNNVITSFPLTTKANTINNLLYGVQAYNSSNKGKTTIQGSVFTNTNSAIYLVNSSSTEVLGNTINLPDPAPSNIAFTCPYGIYIDGGSGFKVEENTISTVNFPATWGIIVNGTGALNNELYNNTLNNLNVAIQPQDENKGISTTTGANLGLRLFCNKYNGTYDTWVAKSIGFNGTVGIAADQRMSYINSQGQSNYFPAANKFSTTFRMDYYDFDNTAGNGLYYYYDNTNPTYKAKPIYYNNIILTPMYTQNSCPSKSNAGSIPINILYSNLATAQIALNSSSTLLNIWKDGGKANLKNEVKTTQPWDVYVEFNNLLAKSPYLSEDVLIATIKNPAFTSLMIKLIMIANPQASRSDKVMGVLYNRVPPLPQNYIDEIKAKGTTISQLDLLVNDVSADYHLLNVIGEDIKRNYRADTTNTWATDSLLVFVSRQPDLLNKYELATIYLNRGLYENMNTCLTNITKNFELTEQQLAEYTDYLTAFSIAQDIYANDKYAESLSGTQQNNLETILANNHSQVSQLALALLIRNNPDYKHLELVLVPTSSSGREIKPNIDATSKEDLLFKVYPNPANNYITIEYRTEDITYTKLWVEIIDATGRKVFVKELQGGNTEELLNLSSLSCGAYTIYLSADGMSLATEKLNIAK